jgi:diaminopimelate epimerase
MADGGIAYDKMNGIGNAIVVLDLRASPIRVSADAARAIAAIEPFDQLMVLYAPRTAGTKAFMRIFNNDGSEAEACGNGTRCVADRLFGAEGGTSLVLETAAGLLPVTRGEDGAITVNMGRPRFAWDEIPLAEPFADTRTIELQVGPIDAPVLHTPSAVNMGNPHAIFWVDDVEAYNLGRVGPLLENHPIFPERANISLAHVTAPDALTLKVWERGAGLTLACGSAACAAAVSAARTKRTGRSVRVSLPGGDLDIVWRPDDYVLMTGPVEYEHAGRLDPAIFGTVAA